MKRIRLLILSVLLMATLIPVSVYAEGDTLEPDVTVFATKQQMMDGTFAPNDQGEPQKKGRITFGKTYSGLSNNIWYILGQDEEIKDGDGELIDNTVIFSNYAVADHRVFNSNTNDEHNEVNYQYTGENTNVYQEKDTDNDGVVSVFVNHYGASDLHKDLTNMASNLTMFSEAEQKLINETTIKTRDNKYGFLYETKDKFYAMTSDYSGSKIIKLGSTDQFKIKTSEYFKHGGLNFWLRSPIDDTGVLFVEGFHTTRQISADSTDPLEILVLPASNLNLTNVLFVSAAKAGSTDIIESNTVMMLRLNGKDKNIGEAYYDEDAKKIIVSKGTAENKVHLIVQGKGSSPYYKQNWYYSKEITGTETIKASDIKQALGLSSDPSLANSKIWLETSDTDGLIYAIEAKKAISNVEIKDIDTPYVNGIPDTLSTCNTSGISNTTPNVTWDPADNPFGYYTEYTASVTLSAEDGYGFTPAISATVNGKTAKSVTRNTDGTLTVTYTFQRTARKQIISIDSLQVTSITVDNGTSYDDMGLPQSVIAYLEDNNTIELAINWNPSSDYNPDKKESQTFTLTGNIVIPESLLYEDILGTLNIKVTVKALKTDSNTNGNHTVIIPDTSVK